MQLLAADGNYLWLMNADGLALDTDALRLLFRSEHYSLTSVQASAPSVWCFYHGNTGHWCASVSWQCSESLKL